MTDRYGNTRVAKIRAAYNDLRAAIRSGDIEAAERALDRYEPWADYAFGAPKVKPLVWCKPYPEADTLAADTVCGRWSVWAAGGCGYVAEPPAAGGKPVPGGIESAKAAAQADYERRILSALAQGDGE